MDSIKRNSTYPYLEFQFRDKDGPKDCTPFQIRLVSKDRLGNVIIDAIIGEPDSGAIWLDEEKGLGEYHWKLGDTQTHGRFYYEYKFIRLVDGVEFSLPPSDLDSLTDSFFTYVVIDDIETETE